MAAVDDPKTLGRTRLSFADQADIDEFVATLAKFEQGEITPDQWRAFRLVRGTYGQRQTGDVQMLRVKIPQGILTSEQLYALADVSSVYSRGFGHITTRQNVQFHFIKLHDVEKAMERLAAAGLTTREACGNSVRNITGCPYSGVAHEEPFDVTPYAEALTRYLLRHPLSSSLPRKFKIAFEGCAEDHQLTAINDIGFRARVRPTSGPDELGFRVTAGGGTSILCSSGRVLFDFLPAGEILNVAEAILRVFHQLGDRQHKQRNRMKFLIKELGWESWRAELEKRLEEFRAAGGARLPFDPQNPPVEEPPLWHRPSPATVQEYAGAAAGPVKGPGILPVVQPDLSPSSAQFFAWLRTNVRRQKQPGYSSAVATVPLGDLTAGQMRVLGEIARAFGDDTVRTSSEQNLVFRWVPDAELAKLYRALAAVGLGLPGAGTIADVASCPGAESCRLAVTQSRGLGRLIGDYLRARPELAAAVEDLRIKISGCPNGCGQHHVAGIGFQGSVRRVGSKVVPQYFVMVGGSVDDSGAHFARVAAKIPARRVPRAIERLAALYRREAEKGESATAFYARVDLPRVKLVLADLEELSEQSALSEDFIDIGEESEFRPETQEGECAA
ncbi:MAG TPA: nitrite/sulfite reductase [Myxococcaceae bacterium]|nr:nitrite/sulfite reductase [Myxococcaceae bacterium]